MRSPGLRSETWGTRPRDFFRESLATITYATFEVSGGFTEGKMDTLDRQIDQSSDSNRGQFEGGSQVLNHMNCMLRRGVWERFPSLNL